MSGEAEDRPAAAVPKGRRDASARLTAGFLDGFQGGSRFCVRFEPAQTPANGTVLCVQPLGDEAAASRRVLAAQAQRLAARGWSTWIVDLYGTGDSAGSSGQASLPAWRADLLRACHLAREACAGPFVLWGLRTGALLAADIAIAQDQLAAAMVFWEPTLAGPEQLGQVDGQAAQSSAADGTPPALERDLGELALQPPMLGAHADPCAVLFVGMDPGHVPGTPPPAALSKAAEQWLSEGYLASLQMTKAAPFWEPWQDFPPPPMPEAAFAITEAFLDCLEPCNGADRIR